MRISRSLKVIGILFSDVYSPMLTVKLKIEYNFLLQLLRFLYLHFVVNDVSKIVQCYLRNKTNNAYCTVHSYRIRNTKVEKSSVDRALEYSKPSSGYAHVGAGSI